MPGAYRSSVRPKSSKQPWGTILEPSFGMGHQKMTGFEIDQTINRLHTVKQERRPPSPPGHARPLSAAQIDDMVSRLTKETKPPSDSKRTQRDSIYSNMGPVNSFAWKGYN